ncbi:MAG: hypothetical protein JNM02_12670 [Anaerolineales bacterium]|nr:hypothetical protein [Anaerolineales bacterium]
MDSEDFVLTINPDPTKRGILIEKAVYNLVRDAILASLDDQGPMTPSQLGDMVEDQLQDEFDHSVYTVVRLDMEVHGELRRVLKVRPRLVGFSGLPCAI